MTRQGPGPRGLLVLGAGGMLGGAMMREADRRGWVAHGRSRTQVDITDATAVRRALAETGAGALVNAAAWTDVDAAEEDEDAALRVNGDGPRVLAEACRDAGATLIHVSTDYVFAGDGDAPYPVDAPLAPLNAYGRTKAAGETAILAVAAEAADRWNDWIIARTAWLYDAEGRNFATTIARLAAERDRLEVVDDQRGRPTAAPELARQLCSLIQANARGIFHCCNDGDGTWCDFARAIVAAHDLRCQVAPCGSDRYPRPAARPAYSVLDLSCTRAAIGPIPSWEDSLRAVLSSNGAEASSS